MILYETIKHEFEYGDDPLQKIDVAFPDNANGKLKIFVHGGGFEGGDKDSVIWTDPDTYLDEGYVVVSINYRLLYDVLWPVPIEDIAAGINYAFNITQTACWLESKPMITDVTLEGASAGAMAIALLLYWEDFSNMIQPNIDRFVGVCGLYNPYEIPTSMDHMLIEDVENLTPEEIDLLELSFQNNDYMKAKLLRYDEYIDSKNVEALLVQGTHDYLDMLYSIPMRYPDITSYEFWQWMGHAHANYLYHHIKEDGGNAQVLWVEGSYHANIYWYPETLQTIRDFIM